MISVAGHKHRQPRPVHRDARDHHPARRRGLPAAADRRRTSSSSPSSEESLDVCFRHHSRGASSRRLRCVAADARPAQRAAVTVRDAGGRTVEVKDASRIVSIGGAVTEILYALGLERPDRRGRHHEPLSRRRRCRRSRTSATCARSRPKACSASTRRWCWRSKARARRKPSRCWKPRPCRSCACPTTTPATASSRRSSWSPTSTGAHGPRRMPRARGRRPISRRWPSCAQKIDAAAKVLFVLSFMNGRPMVAGRNTAADGIIRLAGARQCDRRLRGLQADRRRGGDRRRARRRAGDAAPAGAARRQDGVRACRLRDDAGGGAASLRRRWTGSICSASARAPRAPRAISPPRSIRRSRRETLPSERKPSGCD